MAVGDLIGAAVGVILLVIVAYLLVGSVLSTAQIVTNAQKSATLLEEQQLKTDFTIGQAEVDATGINCTITNTGNEPISDFSQMDVYVYDNSTGNYQVYRYVSSTSGTFGTGTWTTYTTGNDYIHSGELDPSETLGILVAIPWTTDPSPARIQITTANAVSASTDLP
jgi:flagellar protein FlaF